MNDKTASLIRHMLTGLASILMVIGLGKYTGAINLIMDNMDGIMSAISTLAGVVLGVWGFFKGRK